MVGEVACVCMCVFCNCFGALVAAIVARLALTPSRHKQANRTIALLAMARGTASAPKQKRKVMIDEEKVKFHQEQAKMTRYKGFHKKITEALKRNMHICPQIWDNVEAPLRSYGIDPATAAMKQPGGTTSQKGSGADPDGSGGQGGDAVAMSTVSPSKGSRMIDGKISEGYWQVEDLSVTALCEYLNGIDPVALSLQNLKTICCRGKRDQTRRTLWEILEFATNIERSFQIVGDMRIKTKDFDAFANHCYSEAERLGMRCNRLRLPPDWDKAGVYAVWEQAGTLMIKRRFENKCVELPDDMLHGWTPGKQVRIEYNFCENQAKLQLPDRRLPIVCLFGDSGNKTPDQQGIMPARPGVAGLALLGSPMVKRRRYNCKSAPLALMDGDAGVQPAGPRASSSGSGTGGARMASSPSGRRSAGAGVGGARGNLGDDELRAKPPPPALEDRGSNHGDEEHDGEFDAEIDGE